MVAGAQPGRHYRADAGKADPVARTQAPAAQRAHSARSPAQEGSDQHIDVGLGVRGRCRERAVAAVADRRARAASPGRRACSAARGRRRARTASPGRRGRSGAGAARANAGADARPGRSGSGYAARRRPSRLPARHGPRSRPLRRHNGRAGLSGRRDGPRPIHCGGDVDFRPASPDGQLLPLARCAVVPCGLADASQSTSASPRLSCASWSDRDLASLRARAPLCD